MPSDFVFCLVLGISAHGEKKSGKRLDSGAKTKNHMTYVVSRLSRIFLDKSSHLFLPLCSYWGVLGGLGTRRESSRKWQRFKKFDTLLVGVNWRLWQVKYFQVIIYFPVWLEILFCELVLWLCRYFRVAWVLSSFCNMKMEMAAHSWEHQRACFLYALRKWLQVWDVSSVCSMMPWALWLLESFLKVVSVLEFLFW